VNQLKSALNYALYHRRGVAGTKLYHLSTAALKVGVAVRQANHERQSASDLLGYQTQVKERYCPKCESGRRRSLGAGRRYPDCRGRKTVTPRRRLYAFIRSHLFCRQSDRLHFGRFNTIHTAMPIRAPPARCALTVARPGIAHPTARKWWNKKSRSRVSPAPDRDQPEVEDIGQRRANETQAGHRQPYSGIAPAGRRVVDGAVSEERQQHAVAPSWLAKANQFAIQPAFVGNPSLGQESWPDRNRRSRPGKLQRPAVRRRSFLPDRYG